MTVDPRAEARERVGGRFDVRVLEPSPAGYDEAPWLADDPVNAPVSSDRPVVSPVENGDHTWDALAADEPDLADWCADRWLGAWRTLRAIDDGPTFVTTRDALHAVGEHVLAPARHRANGKIGLRFTHRGFGTPFFDVDGVATQLRVDGTDLIVTSAQDVSRTPLPALASESTRSDGFLTPKREEGGIDLGYAQATVWSDDAIAAIDPGAAVQVADWFGFACSVLEAFRCTQPDADTTRVQIWPEHFDMSVDHGDGDAGTRGTFGASPGDAAHPEPYLYVTHWADVARDPFWNDDAFGGASLPYAELLASPDQRATALAFLHAGRALLG